MRTLLFILLWVPASAQHYFVIPLAPANAEAKAKDVSARFFRLSRPDTSQNVTRFFYSWIKHPVSDSIAIELDTTAVIPKGSITSQQITDFITDLYGTLTSTQRTTVINYVNGNTLLRVSRLIITSRVRLWTRAQMEARGWFNFPNMIQ